MDLLGEQTVQLLNATLTAALVLLSLAALLAVSVRVAQSSALRPAVAARPAGTGRLLCPDRDDVWSFKGLRTCLPTRAPPGVHPPFELKLIAPAERRGVGASESFSRSCATPRFRVGLLAF